MAKELWEEEFKSLVTADAKDEQYIKLFQELGIEKKSLDEVLQAILKIIDYCIQKGGVHG